MYIDLKKHGQEKDCFDFGITVQFIKVRAHLPPTDPAYDPGNAYADDLANRWQVENNPEAAEKRKKSKRTSSYSQAKKRSCLKK